MIPRTKLLETLSLEQALESFYGIKTVGRACLFENEAMTGEVTNGFVEKSERNISPNRL